LAEGIQQKVVRGRGSPGDSGHMAAWFLLAGTPTTAQRQ